MRPEDFHAGLGCPEQHGMFAAATFYTGPQPPHETFPPQALFRMTYPCGPLFRLKNLPAVIKLKVPTA